MGIDKITINNKTEILVPPVGYVYTQYPKQKSALELWPDCVWSEISMEYEGAFFRTPGNRWANGIWGRTSASGGYNNAWRHLYTRQYAMQMDMPSRSTNGFRPNDANGQQVQTECIAQDFRGYPSKSKLPDDLPSRLGPTVGGSGRWYEGATQTNYGNRPPYRCVRGDTWGGSSEEITSGVNYEEFLSRLAMRMRKLFNLNVLRERAIDAGDTATVQTLDQQILDERTILNTVNQLGPLSSIWPEVPMFGDKINRHCYLSLIWAIESSINKHEYVTGDLGSNTRSFKEYTNSVQYDIPDDIADICEPNIRDITHYRVGLFHTYCEPCPTNYLQLMWRRDA